MFDLRFGLRSPRGPATVRAQARGRARRSGYVTFWQELSRYDLPRPFLWLDRSDTAPRHKAGKWPQMDGRSEQLGHAQVPLEDAAFGEALGDAQA